MAQSVTVLKKTREDGQTAFENDVRKGLSATPKSIPSRNFYDTRGSNLFVQITRLPSYYLTSTEEAILEKHARDISFLIGSSPTDLIELGSGCSRKTEIILDQLIKDGRDIVFRPGDISHGAMDELEQKVANRYGDTLTMRGAVGDYVECLAYMAQDPLSMNRKKVILLFGSNIGNMTDTEATEFLLKLRTCMKPGDLLIVGFDLKKDLGMLQKAYDDPEGVTAEFNYNLLDRMNRELGANFNRAHFVHHPFYDPNLEAMVSYLVATRDHTVSIPKLNMWVEFREGEGIRTEMSRKFSFADIRRLGERARFKGHAVYTDSKKRFADVVFKPI